ncbi:hypothetical protein HA466_0056720 [Hirschfeldia incana]|nr:hypothetical protein HA466_0056720 [Hirschfeldia incana]
MRTNLRSLVGKAYRVRQGRSFSSSAPSPIDYKGKESVIIRIRESVNRLAPWFVGGYLVRSGLEFSALIDANLKTDELYKEYSKESERYHEEVIQSQRRNLLRLFSEG